MVFNDQLRRIIEKVEFRIQELISEFNENPNRFLTEEDIRAYLYHLLLNDFNLLEQTEDGDFSIPLHTEVRWYGNSGDLKFRSDIVLFNTSTLRTKNIEGFKLPSKGYGFDNPYVIIEIKLRRNIRSSNNKFKKKILADREKIFRIRRKLNMPFKSYILAFDKKEHFDFDYQNNEYHKEFYISSRRK
jgi:hypothetical protein